MNTKICFVLCALISIVLFSASCTLIPPKGTLYFEKYNYDVPALTHPIKEIGLFDFRKNYFQLQEVNYFKSVTVSPNGWIFNYTAGYECQININCPFTITLSITDKENNSELKFPTWSPKELGEKVSIWNRGKWVYLV